MYALPLCVSPLGEKCLCHHFLILTIHRKMYVSPLSVCVALVGHNGRIYIYHSWGKNIISLTSWWRKCLCSNFLWTAFSHIFREKCFCPHFLCPVFLRRFYVCHLYREKLFVLLFFGCLFWVSQFFYVAISWGRRGAPIRAWLPLPG